MGKPGGLPHLYSGKVRELYEVGHDRLLMVASDRVSVFDVVLPDEIPDKGRVLTGVSQFWFDQTAGIVDNHVISSDPTDFPETAGDVGGRAMLVRATRPIRLECVVRGYLFGSGWKEYTERGTVGGFDVPGGLRQAERLPAPLFTPTTKADSGHDLPVSASEAADLVGADVYERLRDLSVRIYELGAEARALDNGLVLADTKFEFGTLDDEILVIDEMMTPDSSRYWPLDAYRVGTSPPSFDKQFVRDFMDSTGWNHDPPAPRMPAEVVEATSALYREAYELLTGESLDDWYGPDEYIAGMTAFEARVEVSHRPGIADPAGATVERALPALGYTNVNQVHIGKVIRLVIDANDAAAAHTQVEEMCERLLADPVIESYEVSIAALAPSP